MGPIPENSCEGQPVLCLSYQMPQHLVTVDEGDSSPERNSGSAGGVFTPLDRLSASGPAVRYVSALTYVTNIPCRTKVISG